MVIVRGKGPCVVKGAVPVDPGVVVPGCVVNDGLDPLLCACARCSAPVSTRTTGSASPATCLSIARREVPSRLLLVGDGPDRVPAREVAEKLGVAKWIRWLGPLDAVEDVFCVADLFLLPSQNESFGLAALEAMSAGVPVISSNAEGLPELVRNGETGFVLPVGDVEGMARRATEILSDEKKHAAMSQAARRVAIENYAVESIIPMYEEFYGRVLGHPVRVPEPFRPPDALA